MRILIVIVALILISSLLGWITFSKTPNRSSVHIETETIRADTKKAMQSGASLLKKAGSEVDQEVSKPEAAGTRPVESAPSR